MSAPYDARQIANWFVIRARQDENVLGLPTILKLCYISHGWHLELLGGPLFDNRIEAWRIGPIIPDVNHSFRKQGVNVTKPVKIREKQFDPDLEPFLEKMYNTYADLSGIRLSGLNLMSGGPWDIARRIGGYYAEIPDDLIKQHYALKHARSKETA